LIKCKYRYDFRSDTLNEAPFGPRSVRYILQGSGNYFLKIGADEGGKTLITGLRGQ